MSAIERFLPLIQDAEDGESIPTPVVSTDDGVNFLYIRHNNLYRMFLCVSLMVESMMCENVKFGKWPKSGCHDQKELECGHDSAVPAQALRGLY
jgi:hypothetical protein